MNRFVKFICLPALIAAIVSESGFAQAQDIAPRWPGEVIKATSMIASREWEPGTNFGLWFPKRTMECQFDENDPDCIELVGGFDHDDWAKYSVDFGDNPPDSMCLWLAVTGADAYKMFWVVFDDVTNLTNKVIFRIRTEPTGDWDRVKPFVKPREPNAELPTGVKDVYIKGYSPQYPGGIGDIYGFQFYSGGTSRVVPLVRSAAASRLSVTAKGRTLQLQLPRGDEQWRVSILKTNGVVASQHVVNASAASVDFGKLSAGTYLVRATSQGRELSQYVTISR